MVETNTQMATALQGNDSEKDSDNLPYWPNGPEGRCIIKGANSHFGLLESKILVKKNNTIRPSFI